MGSSTTKPVCWKFYFCGTISMTRLVKVMEREQFVVGNSSFLIFYKTDLAAVNMP